MRWFDCDRRVLNVIHVIHLHVNLLLICKYWVNVRVNSDSSVIIDIFLFDGRHAPSLTVKYCPMSFIPYVRSILPFISRHILYGCPWTRMHSCHILHGCLWPRLLNLNSLLLSWLAVLSIILSSLVPCMLLSWLLVIRSLLLPSLPLLSSLDSLKDFLLSLWSDGAFAHIFPLVCINSFLEPDGAKLSLVVRVLIWHILLLLWFSPEMGLHLLKINYSNFVNIYLL